MGLSDTRILINGEEVEVDESKEIGATFQQNDIGDISKIKADITSSIQLLDSPRNHKAMKNSAQPGADSEIQLGEINATVLMEGVPLFSNGRARIQGTRNGGYDLNILGGNFDFYEQIKNKNLNDLDWSSYDYRGSALHFTANYQSDEGICFPICDYHQLPYLNQEWNFPSNGLPLQQFSNLITNKCIFMPKLLPWMFCKTILDKIFEEAGFTKSGDIFLNKEYQKMIISLIPPDNTPIWIEQRQPTSSPHTQVVDVVVKDWMPDMSQIDFLKMILNQFGAYIATIDKKVYFIQIKEIYQNESEDWSDKIDLTVKPSIQFETDYAQNNDFEYGEIEELDAADIDYTGFGVSLGNSIDLDKLNYTLVSDNKNLELRKNIAKLNFAPIKLTNKLLDGLKTPSAPFLKTPWIPALSPPDPSNPSQIIGTDYDLEWPTWQSFSPRLAVLVDIIHRDSNNSVIQWQFQDWNFDNTYGSGFQDTYFTNRVLRMPRLYDIDDSSRTTIVSDDVSIAWPELIENHWRQIERSMLKNPQKVIALFNLTAADIYKLKTLDVNSIHGSSKPIYVKQLNGHFYVNRISKFIPGRSVEVELIRI